MTGSAAHLFRRSFDVLMARPLSEDEKEAVRHWLTPALRTLFFAQPVADQRHGYQAARLVIDGGSTSHDVIVAALTHDIAKRHAGLGVMGRSIVSILARLGLRLGGRLAAYRDHGRIGGRELGDAGAPPLAVNFAVHHHGERPSSIGPEVWNLLIAADQPPKAWASIRGWITSRPR